MKENDSMKNLYLIGGTMGVGKTTVSQQLKKILPDAVFLDGDWCWDADPFIVTEETKDMVTDNICHLLNNFLRCSAYENIIFCWVMHQQSIIDNILSRLQTENCAVHSLSLLCSEKELRSRLQKDVDSGIRQPDILERSVVRLPLYRELTTKKIVTDGKTPAQIAGEIAELQDLS
jgi:adenylate kinase family enzyme